MNQRVFAIAFAALLVAVCVSVEAQQPSKIPRIGFLSGSSHAVYAARVGALQQGLREYGYTEGKNILIEYRYAEGRLDRLPALAAELVHLKVDVIVTAGPAVTRAAMQSDRDGSYRHGVRR